MILYSTILDVNNLFLLIWFSIILIAAVVEVMTMDLTSLWFSIGALISFILAIAGVEVAIQIITFIVVTIILLLSVRPLAKRYFRTNIIGTNADRLVGKVATCTREIPLGERGEVKIDGKYWSAITSGDEPIQVDEKVEILAIEGNKLIVVKV